MLKIFEELQIEFKYCEHTPEVFIESQVSRTHILKTQQAWQRQRLIQTGSVQDL